MQCPFCYGGNALFELKGLFVLFALICLPSTVRADHIAIGDLNGDGNVDFADFLILVENFGKKIF